MKHLLIIALMVMACILTCGCLGYNQDVLPSGKYLVVGMEIYYNVNGTCPGWVNNASFYDTPLQYPLNNTSAVYPSGYPVVNNSLKLILGIQHFNGSPDLPASGLEVNGVYSFPYSFAPDLSVTGVDQNGRFTIYWDQDYVLPGASEYGKDSMTVPSGITAVGSYLYPVNGSWSNESFFNNMTLVKITNFGVFEK